MSDTAMFTFAVEDGPLVDVALTVQLPAVAGALYRPVPESMLPQVADQIAGRLAVNCCLPRAKRLGSPGLITIAGVMVAVVEAVWPVPSVAVAITVQEPGDAG